MLAAMTNSRHCPDFECENLPTIDSPHRVPEVLWALSEQCYILRTAKDQPCTHCEEQRKRTNPEKSVIYCSTRIMSANKRA